MTPDVWRSLGSDAAHEDSAAGGDPCDTIDEARRRVGAWLRGTLATEANAEAAAQGYFAAWEASSNDGRGRR